MKLLADRSPSALAALVLLGGLMSASVFLIGSPKADPLWLDIVAVLLLLGGGVVLTLKACTELKDGIANQRWTELQLAPLRSNTASTVTLIFAMLVVGLFVMTFFVSRHNHLHEIVWPTFLVSQSVSQIQIALRRPAVAVSSASRFTSSTPIALTSSHWGER
jgi:hypothetical protein